MQNYQQENLTQQADIGNRLQRVELNKTRLTEQQTNVKELKSENEDIELEDVLINYASAELVYNSSLSAASKVVRQSLLDFL
jgi:flagellar hook-associated protein 3 FlgL